MKISVKVVPRSAKNEIIGQMADGVLKIKLTAPPTDGKANQSLINLLAEKYHKSKNKIKIISGQTSRKKIVWIAE